jgi:hypothetical protein
LATFGVVYVAYGAPYLAMAVTSLISLRVTNPTVPVCIITNVVKELPSQPWWQPEIGDRWIVLEEETGANRNAKTSVYGLSPFDLTLYLDCDTMVLGDLSPIPGYLEYFDLLLSPVYRPNPRTKRRILEGKYRYTEDGHFNGGVFGFRRNAAAEEFFALWNERFNAMGYRLDQPSLVEAAYLSKVRIFPLPDRWNTGDRWSAFNGARDEIRIWHYKYRPEPALKTLIRKSVGWFGGTEAHQAETDSYLYERRNHKSLRWLTWLLTIRLRGQLSRRLEAHPNRDRWIRWTRQ